MSTISANTLYHFTNSAENIVGILENEFQSKYCLEDCSYAGDVNLKLAFPMICFCDLPLSQIKNHLKTYGSYGIGMSKEWGIKNGLNPVLYVEKGSLLNQSLEAIIENIVKMDFNDTGLEENIFLNIVNIVRCMKAYKGDLFRDGETKKNIRFYDEREWRYIPDVSQFGGRMSLGKEEFQNSITRANENSKIKDVKLKFEPNDINYIIVSKKGEILSMIEAIEDIKGLKYDSDTVKTLTSKILTSEQIKEDF